MTNYLRVGKESSFFRSTQINLFLSKQIKNPGNAPLLHLLPEYVKYVFAVMPDRNDILLKKEEINEFMENLLSEPEQKLKQTNKELILLGESSTMEFKSSLQWDIFQDKQNKSLRKQILKTIAAFLNSAGGILLIGIEDEGNILGLGLDLSIFNGSIDKFSSLLATLISDYIGVEFAPLIEITFDEIEDKTICKITVEKSYTPVYIRGDRGSEFWVRFGPTSRMIDSEETVNYINQNWN